MYVPIPIYNKVKKFENFVRYINTYICMYAQIYVICNNHAIL